jgi:hypothetical protein
MGDREMQSQCWTPVAKGYGATKDTNECTPTSESGSEV